jgi:hypothetical protein
VPKKHRVEVIKRKVKRPDGSVESVDLYPDHKLQTRRDFLSSGLIGMSSYVFAPSLIGSLLSSSSFASCESGSTGSSGGPSLPAFVQFNLAGGAMLASNLIPRDTGGNLIPSFSLMGLGTGAALSTQLTSGFGITDGWFNNAGLLLGLNDARDGVTASNPALTRAANYQNNTRVISIVARSRDDSDQNPLDVAGLVASAGLAGSLMPILSSSRFRQTAVTPVPAPLIVNSVDDLSAATGLAGALGDLENRRGTPVVEALFETIRDLSDSEVSRLLASVSNGAELDEAVSCATEANVAVVGAPDPTVDPRGNADLQAVWGINAGSSANSTDVVFASSVYNAVNGQAGSVRLERGGYDYHNGTRTTGDERDRTAGQYVGRMLQTAAVMNQRMFLFLTTDGSCRAPESDVPGAVWTSDRGQAGELIMFVYDPAGRPSSSGTGFRQHQIGHLTNGQAADQNFIPGWNAERAALAAVANYLRWSVGAGWESVFNAALAAGGKTNPFSTSDLNQIMKLG